MSEFNWSNRLRRQEDFGPDEPDYETVEQTFSAGLKRRKQEDQQENNEGQGNGAGFGPIQKGALRRGGLSGFAGASAKEAELEQEDPAETNEPFAAPFDNEASESEKRPRGPFAASNEAPRKKNAPSEKPGGRRRDGTPEQPRLWNFMGTEDVPGLSQSAPIPRPKPVPPSARRRPLTPKHAASKLPTPTPTAPPTSAHRQQARDAVFGDVVGRERLSQLQVKYPGLTAGGSDEEALDRLRRTDSQDRAATGPAASAAGEEASDPYVKAPYRDLPANAGGAAVVKRTGGEAERAKAEAAHKERIRLDTEPGALADLVGKVARDLALSANVQASAQSIVETEVDEGAQKRPAGALPDAEGDARVDDTGAEVRDSERRPAPAAPSDTARETAPETDPETDPESGGFEIDLEALPEFPDDEIDASHVAGVFARGAGRRAEEIGRETYEAAKAAAGEYGDLAYGAAAEAADAATELYAWITGESAEPPAFVREARRRAAEAAQRRIDNARELVEGTVETAVDVLSDPEAALAALEETRGRIVALTGRLRELADLGVPAFAIDTVAEAAGAMSADLAAGVASNAPWAKAAVLLAGRPGGKRFSLEDLNKRLQDLERLAGDLGEGQAAQNARRKRFARGRDAEQETKELDDGLNEKGVGPSGKKDKYRLWTPAQAAAFGLRLPWPTALQAPPDGPDYQPAAPNYFGRDRLGRNTGVSVDLVEGRVSQGLSDVSSEALTALGYRKGAKDVELAHLFAAMFGGSNDEPRNFVPADKRLNKPMMQVIEYRIKNALDRRKRKFPTENVRLQVRVLYPRGQRFVGGFSAKNLRAPQPTALLISVRGSKGLVMDYALINRPSKGKKQ